MSAVNQEKNLTRPVLTESGVMKRDEQARGSSLTTVFQSGQARRVE